MKLRGKFLVGFFALTILVALGAALSFTSMRALTEARRQVAFTEEVATEAVKTQRVFTDIEAALKGFVITGREEALGPYNSGKVDFATNLDHLRELVADNPAQSRRIEAIDRKFRRWEQMVGDVEIARTRTTRNEANDGNRLAMLVTTGVGKTTMDAIRARAHQLDQTLETAGNNDARYHLMSVIKSAVDMETGQRGFLVTGREEFLEPFVAGRAEISLFMANLRRAVSRASGPSAGAATEAIDEIEKLHHEWLKNAGELEIEARRRQDRDRALRRSTATHLNREKGEVLADQLRQMLDRFASLEFEAHEAEELSADRTMQIAWYVELGCTLLAIILGLGVTILVIRNVLRQVGGDPSEIADLTEQIARGDLDIKLAGDGQTTTGILASVQSMARALRTSRAMRDNESWLESGISRLNDVMLGEENLTELARKVINEVCRQIGAQIGAVYIRDGEVDDPVFALLGTYAYVRRHSLSNQYMLGEGLVGQAALEQRQIVVDNIPRDYVKIVSGTGASTPRCICVTPLVHDGRVRGVLEIGTLCELTTLQLDYLSRAVPAIAISIESVQSRGELSRALHKSRELSESLQFQQEELQAANEELEEQAVALRHSEDQLKLQREELQATNEALEAKTTDLERQAFEIETAHLALASKAAELSKASTYKSEFLANMSHELRTPLNSLLLLARMLRNNKEGNLTESQVESARHIYESGTDLLELINEILDLSKIEAGFMEVRPEFVTLNSIAEALNDSFAHMAVDRALDFQVRVAEDTPAHIITDPKRLLQILKNLISNALKFTDQGGISIRFRRATPDLDKALGDLDPRQALAVSVTDTGIGISPEQQKLVFHAFQQVQGGSDRQYGGTGLGLSISRKLAGLLGGLITLESAEGQGSTFTIYLPLDAPLEVPTDAPLEKELTEAVKVVDVGSEPRLDPEPESAADSFPFEQLTGQLTGQQSGLLYGQPPDDRGTITEDDQSILVIDGDVDFARELMRCCHDMGFKCLVASTGEEGLQIAAHFGPHAVILEINLPDIDGWTVLETLKHDTYTRHIPVHVVSEVEPSTAAFRKGAIGHLHKPVSPESLRAVFSRIESATSSAPKRLLVVEDNEKTRRAIVDLVGGTDVVVDEASGAQSAIEAVLARPYDCMILDLGLWDMDGEKLLEAIEGDTEAQMPPVIVYTGRELSREEEHRLREYTESIIIKDVRSEERLLDEVSLRLHRVVSDMPNDQRQLIVDLHGSDEVFDGKKILLVDDDMRSVFALSKQLADRGVTPLKAENGQRALQVLDEHPDVALILTDIMMPVMDGYDTMERIRAQPRFTQTPIIALTAKAMKGDMAKCRAVGANDYLTKPLDLDRLLSMMRVWLSRDETRRHSLSPQLSGETLSQVHSAGFTDS